MGIPTSYEYYQDFLYNLNAVGTQSSSLSNYVSYLRRDIYDQPNGPLLNQKLASYAEVCFDLAEAAQRGWNVRGTDADWYNNGIQASFDNWQVFSTYQSDVNAYYGCVKDYNSYVAQPSVAYDGTIDRIMEQKWIAGWQTCNEAYMDWRRTGFPGIEYWLCSFQRVLFHFGSCIIMPNCPVIQPMHRLLLINWNQQPLMDRTATIAHGQNFGYCRERASLGDYLRN